MRIEICNGCDACWLRCAHDVQASREEWMRIQAVIAHASEARKEAVLRVRGQDKLVSLGDDVTVEMCRYWDTETRGCAVYEARPLVCRLLGHVEWLPCPIEKVPEAIPTPDALALMDAYASLERRTFAEWDAQDEDDS